MSCRFFAYFPIPVYLWNHSREQLNYHLNRIEKACSLPKNAIVQTADYVEVNDDFGICTFVIGVV